jgi:uncharacterized membrane protein YdjX (TVP38/TMEM64 family)
MKERNINKDMPKKSLAWIEPLLLLIIVMGISLSIYLSGLLQFFTSKESILQFIGSLGTWDEAGFVLLEATQVVIPAIPGTVLNVLGGYLYGTVGGVILSTTGTTIGAYIAFVLSRRFGKQLIGRLFNKRITRHLESILHKKSRSTLFLLFLIPGFPKDYLCYSFGHLYTMEFLTITIIGRFFGTVLETLGGDYIRHAQYQRLCVLVIIGISIVIIAAVFRDKIERVLRLLHILEYKKQKARLKHRTSLAK